MSRNILTVALAFLLMFSWGCDDYLDINQDPNVLSDIPDAKVLLPSAQVGLANQLMMYHMGVGGGFWSQYWTQSYDASQFKVLCEYQENSFNDAYIELTTHALTDLRRIKKLTSDLDDKGLYYVAEALSIFGFQILTDVWGDIPYFEALKGDEGIYAPAFDKQEDIYTDLLSRIDALVAMDLTGFTLDASFDFVYGGELAMWKRFVNSLKLKLMIRLSETSGYDNATVLAFVNSSDFISGSAKIDGSVWSDGQEGKRHPMRELEEGGATTLSSNVIACKTFLDYLKVNGDPRLQTLFEAKGGVYEGAFFGDFDSKADSDGDGTYDEDEDYSTTIFTADMDLMLMSTWEVYFYIAEVYVRAGDNVNAKVYYDQAVTASLAQHGLVGENITGAGEYAEWVDGTVEEGIKQIAMQKWVANAHYQHIESFLERNRTKYPAVSLIDVKADRRDANDNFPVGYFTLSVNGRAKTNDNLPASPTYPSEILNRNINAPSQKANLLEKVWWNQKIGK